MSRILILFMKLFCLSHIIFFVNLINMYLIFIFLSFLICTSYGVKYRKSYQDETSWSFQHPTTRYKNININSGMVQILSTISMNATSSVSNFICFKSFMKFMTSNLFTLHCIVTKNTFFIRRVIPNVHCIVTWWNAAMWQNAT